MPTRTGVLIPIVAAAFIIGVAGMLTLPTDIKLESVEFPRGTIMINDKILEVQIADTKELRTRGLSWSEKLPYNEGMLFVFDGSGTYSMWMIGMLFNLDIIWLDENCWWHCIVSWYVLCIYDAGQHRQRLSYIYCRYNSATIHGCFYTSYNSRSTFV